jgi:hypothetical protein
MQGDSCPFCYFIYLTAAAQETRATAHNIRELLRPFEKKNGSSFDFLKPAAAQLAEKLDSAEYFGDIQVNQTARLTGTLACNM